jgi:hypothetical protein
LRLGTQCASARVAEADPGRHVSVSIPAPNFPGAGIFQQLLGARQGVQMFWSELIRYAALAGEIALAVGIAAIITMVLKYAIG